MSINMNEWKKICVSLLFIIAGVAVADSSSLKRKNKQKTIVTMKDSEGQIQHFSKASSSEISAIFMTPINEANAFVMKARHMDCKKVAKDVEQQAHYLMELPFIIESLNKDSKYPVLSQLHKDILSRTPLCEPYLLDLKIIAFLLNGWKLEKKVTKVRKKSRK